MEDLRRTVKGCLWTAIIGIIMATIGCCILIWFAWFPFLHGAVEDELSPVVSTGIAQLAATPGTLSQDQLTIPYVDLNEIINGKSNKLQVSGISYSAENRQLRIDFHGQGNQHAAYRFDVGVDAAGQLTLSEPQGNGGLEAKLLAPESIAGATEFGINDTLSAHGLVATSVDLTRDGMVIAVKPSPPATPVPDGSVEGRP